MTIEVLDSDGNVCDEGDVILQHYPFGKKKYLGILTFLKESCDIVLSDGDQGWKGFPEAEWMRYERICNIKDEPHLDKYLGLNEFGNQKRLSEFREIMEASKKEPIERHKETFDKEMELLDETYRFAGHTLWRIENESFPADGVEKEQRDETFAAVRESLETIYNSAKKSTREAYELKKNIF